MQPLAALRLFVLPVVFAIVLSACGGGAATTSGAEPASPAPAVPSGAPSAAQPATATPVVTQVLTPTGIPTSATPRPTPTPTISTAPAPSETPDASAFKTYFREVSLGKLPVGTKAGPGACPSPSKAFTAKDQLCFLFDVRKVPQGATDGIYDIAAASFVRIKADLDPPIAATGERVVCVPLTLAPGKYEYKVWVGDALAALVPFDVK